MDDSNEGAEKDLEGIKVITYTRTAAKHLIVSTEKACMKDLTIKMLMDQAYDRIDLQQYVLQDRSSKKSVN
jgi:hypothetical protein